MISAMGSSPNAPTFFFISVSALNAPTSSSLSPTLSFENASDELKSGYYKIETFYGNKPLDAYYLGGLHSIHFGNLFHHRRLMIV